jgi:hypothetical protein
VLDPILTIGLAEGGPTDSSGAAEQSGCKARAEPLFPSHEEPYLLVWIVPAASQRELIKVFRGPTPLAQIGTACCMVFHPHSVDEQGALTRECRAFLIGAVQNAVNATGFRMCIVWSSSSCTFVHLDGSVRDGSDPASRSFHSPREIASASSSPVGRNQGEA